MVIVTPEIVRPIPAGQTPPELNYPQPFMTPNSDGRDAHSGNGADRSGAGEAGGDDAARSN